MARKCSATRPPWGRGRSRRGDAVRERRGPGAQNAADRREEAERRGDNGRARSDFSPGQGKPKGVGAGRTSHSVFHVELKGGGDAVSAARAVIQTGEYDYAWNMQVEDEILRKLEGSGSAKGRAEIVESRGIEHIQLNSADPWTEVDGERSNLKTKHPLLNDPAVRQALRLLVDRASIEVHIYGRTGVATGNFLNLKRHPCPDCAKAFLPLIPNLESRILPPCPSCVSKTSASATAGGTSSRTSTSRSSPVSGSG